MKEKVDFKLLAEKAIFRPKEFMRYVEDNNIKFRKNKGIHEVKNAIVRAMQWGSGSTEFEIGMLELYLKDIFKVHRKVK